MTNRAYYYFDVIGFLIDFDEFEVGEKMLSMVEKWEKEILS